MKSENGQSIKGAYMIAVAEMYGIHPQTLRLYEREPASSLATKATSALYTDEICSAGVHSQLAALPKHQPSHYSAMREPWWNAAQIQDFVKYIQEEVLSGPRCGRSFQGRDRPCAGTSPPPRQTKR